jgi:hypothetical protein
MMITDNTIHVISKQNLLWGDKVIISYNNGIWSTSVIDNGMEEIKFIENTIFSIITPEELESWPCRYFRRDDDNLLTSCNLPNQPSLLPFFYVKGSTYIAQADSANLPLLITSKDSGTTWQHVKLTNTPTVVTDIIFRNDTEGYVVDTYGKVYLTTNGGDSWSHFRNLGIPIPFDQAKMKMSGSDIYVSTHHILWKNFSNVCFNDGQVIGMDFFENTGYVVLTGGDVRKTTDGGISWTHEMNLVLGPSEGFFNSGDLVLYKNGTWYILSPGERKIYYKNPLTGVQEIDGDVDDSFSLLQNYPNPFNPTTKITYTLADDNFVSLLIYNITGKEIRNLVNEPQSKGTYSVIFDGSSLTNGIYFYRIRIGDFIETKKMILIK